MPGDSSGSVLHTPVSMKHSVLPSAVLVFRFRLVTWGTAAGTKQCQLELTHQPGGLVTWATAPLAELAVSCMGCPAYVPAGLSKACGGCGRSMTPPEKRT